MTDLRKIIDELTELPTLPDVVAKLNRMISDPSTSAGNINDVISRDLALSAKILRLVNSPFYGFSRRITTITYAVVILGFNTVRNIALSAFIFSAFKEDRKTGFDVKDFWRHAIGTAIATSAVAREIDGVSDEDAFMAGLLHDIGKIVMNQFMHDDFIKVMDKVNADDCLFRDAEKAVLDFDHSELGALLLERWNLPHKLVDAVRYCYRPSEAEENLELAAVTHFGHVLSRSLCVGSAGDARVTPLDQAAFERLGIPWDRVDMLMGKITAELANADEFLVLA